MAKSSFGPRFQMAACLVVSALLTVGHHLFYAHLDGRPVETEFHIGGQQLTNALSNLIANIARLGLTTVVGIALTQLLWLHLRQKEHPISEISAAMACTSSPFTPSSLPAWFSPAFFLAIMAFLSTTLSVVTIIVPGAISVDSSGTYSGRCAVLVPNHQLIDGGAMGDIKGRKVMVEASSQMVTLTSIVLAQTAYIAPRGSCTSECQYNISFLAPTMNCTDTTLSTNFAEVFPNNDFIFWNSTFGWPNGQVTLQAASQIILNRTNGLILGNGSAVSCVAYNATYRVTIHQKSSNDVSLTLIDSPQEYNALSPFLDPLDFNSSSLSLNALALGVGTVLGGFMSYDPSIDSNTFLNESWILSDLIAGTPIDLMDVIPSLMQNLSISILSGYLDVPDQNITTLSRQNTTCIYPAVLFRYNSTRLLATYGAALFVAIVCAAFGLYAIHANGVEESLGFPRLLQAIRPLVLSPATPSELTPETKLIVGRNGTFQCSAR